MYVRTDEAGDFSFENTSVLRIAVVAGVLIPDRSWDAVREFVDQRRSDWDMTELKAADLDGDQLAEMAQFFVDEDLRAAAVASDSNIFSAAAQGEWRDKQFKEFEEAAARSTRAVSDPEVRERVERTRTRMNKLGHVSQPDFLQYSILTPALLAYLFSAALRQYRTLGGDEEGWLFDVAMDAKGGADPGKAGQLLRDSLEAIYASDDRTALRMPAEWPDDHPFKIKNQEEPGGPVTVRKMLAAGIVPGTSHEDAGLQLADFVAHLVLSLLRLTPDEDDFAAWRILRQVMVPTDDGWPIKAWSWPDGAGSAADEIRYRRLAEP